MSGPAGWPGRGHRLRSFRALSRAMFLGYVRDRAALVFSVLIPVLFLVLLGSIYRNPSTPRISVLEVGRVSLLDQARAAAPRQLSAVMAITREGSLAGALQKVRAGTDDAAVQERGGQLIVHDSVADPARSAEVAAVFTSVVQQANLAVSGRAPATGSLSIRSRTSPSRPSSTWLPGSSAGRSRPVPRSARLPRWSAGGRTSCCARLRLAPVSTAAVVTARIGISVAIGIVQLFVFLAIATTPYFGLRLTASWWMAIPVVICGTLAFMAIGLLVGALARTQQAASSIANLIILPMAFLAGAFVPLDFAPGWMRQVSYVLPLRYLVTGTQDVMARGLGPASALPAIGILLAFTVVLTVIAARLFRWEEI